MVFFNTQIYFHSNPIWHANQNGHSVPDNTSGVSKGAENRAGQKSGEHERWKMIRAWAEGHREGKNKEQAQLSTQNCLLMMPKFLDIIRSSKVNSVLLVWVCDFMFWIITDKLA